MADAGDLKSLAERREGSIPSGATTTHDTQCRCQIDEVIDDDSCPCIVNASPYVGPYLHEHKQRLEAGIREHFYFYEYLARRQFHCLYHMGNAHTDVVQKIYGVLFFTPHYDHFQSLVHRVYASWEQRELLDASSYIF